MTSGTTPVPACIELVALSVVKVWAERHANRYEDPVEFGKAVAKLVTTVYELGTAEDVSGAATLQRERAEYNRVQLQELRQAERNSQTYKGTQA